jgi:co-chaperonin GroES (HSP10)
MTLKEYKPKWRWVVVELVDITKTNGGIFLPVQGTVLNPLVMTVIAVGPDCTTTKPGDTVMVESLGLAKSLEFYDSGSKKIYSVMEQQIMGSFEESKPIKKKK